MKSKVVIGLIIVGIIFLGSATYALFNENLLLNDVASDIQTNDTTQSNNQHNIQNNQPNIQNNPANSQNNPLTNIISGENSNFVPNNMANVVLNGIGDNSVVNDDVGQKIVKEVRRITINNQTHIFYDDYSCVVIEDNMTYNGQNVLKHVVDTDSVSGGYIECSDCGKFVPVGDVSGLVPEDYLCDCGAYIMSIKDVPFVYSEESVLENIKHSEYYKNNVGIPDGNPFYAPSKNTDTVDNISVSDEVPQENVENNNINIEDSYSPIVLSHMSDHMDFPVIEHRFMDSSNLSEDL